MMASTIGKINRGVGMILFSKTKIRVYVSGRPTHCRGREPLLGRYDTHTTYSFQHELMFRLDKT